MTDVLLLSGKPVDWSNPPGPTEMVRWSDDSTDWGPVRGSMRTICHLDWMSKKAEKNFGRKIVVIQPPFNVGYAPSAGTHDKDACKDWFIPGVSWWTMQRFGRAHGDACWYRHAPLFSNHIHGFTIPADGHHFATDVGIYVDGGVSTQGRLVTSSQLGDYWGHQSALVGHAHDPSWFPKDISKTIFNLAAYIKSRKEADMQYLDWDNKSKQALRDDILDKETVSVRKSANPDDGFEKISIREAIGRAANAPMVIREAKADIKSKLD